MPDKLESILDGDLDGYLKKLLCIEENTSVSAIFNLGYDFLESAAPIIGNGIQNMKIRNLKKGLKELNFVVANIGVTLNELQEKFIQEKALPLILKNMMQEEQEEKIKILVNGLESIINDSMYEEDSLFEFYDVLNSLRKKEIARLLEMYNKEIQNQDTYNIGNFEFDGTSLEYIDNKLVQLGLRKVYVINAGTWGALESPEEDTAFTDFGKDFIKFFRNRKIND
ncbi:hypothetical protein SRABI134_00726 [Peribacillus sp. Bi134]|nr:hypothetical protein SRABI134_00726 [Peribacillus sp. Bi134]